MSKFAQDREKQSKAVDKEKTSTDRALPSRNIIIGGIVERVESDSSTENVIENVSFGESSGFPRAKRIDQKVLCPLLSNFEWNLKLY